MDALHTPSFFLSVLSSSGTTHRELMEEDRAVSKFIEVYIVFGIGLSFSVGLGSFMTSFEVCSHTCSYCCFWSSTAACNSISRRCGTTTSNSRAIRPTANEERPHESMLRMMKRSETFTRKLLLPSSVTLLLVLAALLPLLVIAGALAAWGPAPFCLGILLLLVDCSIFQTLPLVFLLFFLFRSLTFVVGIVQGNTVLLKMTTINIHK
mmetsp:Transcript_105049/g.214168  ORF Transcript_105049/g.214168 Transcript_105049/m.214168 type:complete len:208 (-) Transcript_105049:20-643(-)